MKILKKAKDKAYKELTFAVAVFQAFKKAYKEVKDVRGALQKMEDIQEYVNGDWKKNFEESS